MLCTVTTTSKYKVWYSPTFTTYLFHIFILTYASKVNFPLLAHDFEQKVDVSLGG